MRIFSLLAFLPLLFTHALDALVVKSPLTDHFQARPGEIKRAKLELYNESDLPLHVQLTPSDYAYQATGDTFFNEPNSHPHSNASWIELSTSQVTIPPKSDAAVFYTVRVPQESSLTGSYWSLILIEPDTLHMQKVTSESSEFQLQVKVRYAHQIVSDLPKGQARLNVLNKRIAQEEGTTLLFLDLHNEGTLYLAPIPTLKLYDARGELVHEQVYPREKVLPGSSVRLATDLGKRESKTRLFALLLLDNGDASLFGHRFEVEIP